VPPATRRHRQANDEPPTASGVGRSDDDRALYEIANRIRTYYILAYRDYVLSKTGEPSDFGDQLIPRWDGGQGPDGRTYQPIWYEIARAALAHRIDPLELVPSAFSEWDGAQPPLPTALITKKALERAEEYGPRAVEDAQLSLENERVCWVVEANRLQRHEGLDANTAARRALRNGRLELSPIFRYCTATQAGDRETADKFLEAARVQYLLRKRAFDTAWGEMIPAELKEYADQVLRNGRA
jgi:hypothetical protein